MCGFAGFLAWVDQAPPTPQLLERMSSVIAHRGPDDQGQYFAGGVGLAFRRLAILDISPSGHQPMIASDGMHVLVFNGEIFNYVELRAELSGLGHTFSSSGDSAVLLAAYRQWGTRCVEKFVGMFAFCIHDVGRGTLFLARDRFGVKPLYLLRSPRGLAFASELKSIRASGLWNGKLNESKFASLLVQQRVDSLDETEDTFLADVVQLPAAHWLEVTPDRRETLSRYWALPDRAGELPRDPLAEFAQLFDDSMQLQMRSDVPVGVMLSGGMDSSTIACTMARLVGSVAERDEPLHAFCYESAEFDESVQLKDTASLAGVILHRYTPDPGEVWAEMRRVLWYHDEPVHSASVLMGFGLYRTAAEQGVRVVLGGQGADEVIGGYPYLFEHMLVSHALSGRIPTMLAEARSLAHPAGQQPMQSIVFRTLQRVRAHLMAQSSGYRTLAMARRLAEAPGWEYVSGDFGLRAKGNTSSAGAQDLRSQLRIAAGSTPLPSYLRVEDRNAMAHSVEGRVPFLDHRLAEFCVALPPQWQMTRGWNKYVLREAMRERLPESVVNRRVKFGFPTSVRSWFAGPLAAAARSLILDGPLRATGWVKMDRIEAALEKQVRGEGDFSDILFNAAQLTHWLSLHAQQWEKP